VERQKEVVSRGKKGPIEIEIKFKQDISQPKVTYTLQIALNGEGLPIVAKEVLKYRRGSSGKPWHFLSFSNGVGSAITNEYEYGEEDAKAEREEQQLDSPNILAIKGLGQFQKFKQVAAFRRFIEGWHVSDFHIESARGSKDVGHSEHLSPTGDNLPLVAKFMYEYYRERFEHVLEKMSQRVPGVTNIEAAETTDGRIVLRFQDGTFKDPFIDRYVSDGTIKMFAYLLLLNDPKPHPLLCIEEPENQLHPTLLDELVEEFREYTQGKSQVFISTHSPDFVNNLEPKELFWLVKENGFTKIKRASEDPQVCALVAQGDMLGSLWKQGLLRGAGPQ